MPSKWTLPPAVLAASMIGPSTLHAESITDLSASEQAQGLWMSDGYGYLLAVSKDEDEPRLYHITDTVCVPVSDQEDVPFSYLESFAVNETDRQLVFKLKEEAYRITFNRVWEMPAHCEPNGHHKEATPQENFDAFVSYFRTNYSFLHIHNPTWLETAEKFRSQLGADSTDSDIIELMIRLLSTLKDGHVSISATIDGDEGEFIAHPGPTLSAVQSTFTGQGSPMAAFGQQFLREDIETRILGGKGSDAANERIKYGLIDDRIGYIAIMAVASFAPGQDPTLEDEKDALERALDDVLAYMAKAGVEAILMDLSVNRGGYDFLARQIASRFAKEPHFAYSRFAGDAHDQTPQGVLINPSNRPSFHGPVFVLTSDVTVSAAETLTLSMRALPNVTHIGSRTRGALSDVLTKRLPNGWTITLSNEVYRDHRGESWEGRGIPPEPEWEVFDPANPFSGHMPSVERSIEFINSRLDAD